MWLEGAFKVY